MTKFKIGSLFDGSGGFPLAASMCGIEPTWAAEVEPYPIAVTRSRFPNMKHLGSVTEINGAEIEPVDIITFGSPCQDLSVAGKRAGLKHEANGDEETTRSGLFMEAVRIIREMKEATNGRHPTFALFENVHGAFSSNKGEDFRTVCEELIKIVEPGAVMPAVPQKGWPYADSYCGDGWSLAYRVFDAQYWGVPQRRRRIHLVLDLRGERAGKVLFEREGLCRNYPESGAAWQATAGDAQSGAGADDREGDCVALYQPMSLREENWAESNVKNAIRANESKSSHAIVCKTFDARGNGDGETVSTLTGDHENRITEQESASFYPQRKAESQCFRTDGVSNTLVNGTNPGFQNAVIQPIAIDPVCEAEYIDTSHADDVVRTDTITAPLQARDYKGGKLVRVRYIVRRLTPTECARLQGFPDAWGHPISKDSFTDEEYSFWLDVRNTHAAINGKATKEYTKEQMLKWYNGLHTDSAEYKMWGNGIALPPALYCMQGMAEALEAEQ